MFVVAIFWAFVRVGLFVCLSIALLRVSKTRLRHVPTRRTRISRHHGETTLWLERLVNAIIDMLRWRFLAHGTAGKETGKRVHPPPPLRAVGASAEPQHSATSAAASTPATGSSGGKDEDFLSDLDDPDDPNRPAFLVQLEERVNAMLEDSGIAAWADFRIRSLGEQPPRMKAIHIIHAGANVAPTTAGSPGTAPCTTATSPVGSASTNPTTSTASPPATAGDRSASLPTGGGPSDYRGGSAVPPMGAGDERTATASSDAPSTAHRSPQQTVIQASMSAQPVSAVPTPPSDSNVGGVGVSARVDGGGSTASLPSVDCTPAPLPGGSTGGPSAAASAGAAASSSSGNTNSSGNNANNGAGGSGSNPCGGNPTNIEFEAEVEYAGGLDISLRADLSFLRGRQLPLQVRFHEVKYMRAHIRVAASLQYDAPSLEPLVKPYLTATIWLESDPAFDLTMRTSITRLGIRNFFLIPVLLKFFLLRFLRARLRRSNGGPGVTVKIPLPEDIVDGGERWRSGGGGFDGPGDDSHSSRAGTSVNLREGSTEASWGAAPQAYWGSPSPRR